VPTAGPGNPGTASRNVGVLVIEVDHRMRQYRAFGRPHADIVAVRRAARKRLNPDRDRLPDAAPRGHGVNFFNDPQQS